MEFSARVTLLQEAPYEVHAWNCTPLEYQRFLWNPRAFLKDIGIALSPRCRIETQIENHDWIGARADALKPAPDIVVSNIGRIEPDRSVYRIVSRGHDVPTDVPRRARSRVTSARR